MIESQSVQHRIQQLAEPLAAREGLELVFVEVARAGARAVIRVTLDRDGGVTLDDCAAFSRQLGALLEVEDPVPGSYDLEVSSPGLDRRLLRRGDYVRFFGREVRISLSLPQAGRRNFKGRLIDLEEDIVVLRTDEGGDARIPLTAIKVARLVPEI